MASDPPVARGAGGLRGSSWAWRGLGERSAEGGGQGIASDLSAYWEGLRPVGVPLRRRLFSALFILPSLVGKTVPVGFGSR